MKKLNWIHNLALVMIAAIATQVHASKAAEFVYNSLQTLEVRAEAESRLEYATQKQVGGLTCTKITAFQQTKYTCTLQQRANEAEKIFNALDVPIETESLSWVELRQTKKAGFLTCSRTNTSLREYEYVCEIQF